MSYYGAALDEKTPLLRANEALNTQGKRLLSLLGYDVEEIVANIGLEQEIFLVPRDQYLRRPDLQMTGRTVIGKNAPRGQEMCDHYMAPPSTAQPALEAMQEMQEEVRLWQDKTPSPCTIILHVSSLTPPPPTSVLADGYPPQDPPP